MPAATGISSAATLVALSFNINKRRKQRGTIQRTVQKEIINVSVHKYMQSILKVIFSHRPDLLGLKQTCDNYLRMRAGWFSSVVNTFVVYYLTLLSICFSFQPRHLKFPLCCSVFKGGCSGLASHQEGFKHPILHGIAYQSLFWILWML